MSQNTSGNEAAREEAKRAIDAIKPESAAGTSSSDAAQFDPNTGKEAGGESDASSATSKGSEGNEGLPQERGN